MDQIGFFFFGEGNGREVQESLEDSSRTVSGSDAPKEIFFFEEFLRVLQSYAGYVLAGS